MKLKSKKSALLLSFTSLLLCFAMLAGSTFAWFTDTATTGVNRIQSGTLDVELWQNKGTKGNLEWAKVEDGSDPLNWVTNDGRAQDQIFWEPGCTYELPQLKIVNNGNLALKYKIQINGIQGDAKLNQVIDWTMTRDDATTVLGTEHHLAAKTGETVDADILTISGKMQTTAGNEYQNLTIDGIAITVYATQDTVENDSYGPTYDENATYYPVLDAAGLKDALVNGGEIQVVEDVNTSGEDTFEARMIVSKPTTLQLDKKIISPDNMSNNEDNFVALIVDADTTINAGPEGGIDTGTNGGYAINVRNGAKLTINSGDYYGGGTAVQVQKGTLIINGGFFAVEPFSDARYGYNFLLNCIDSAYKNGSAKIIVKGGTFVNFDPSNNTAEGAGTNFVAEGYSVISEQHGADTWYTVVKGQGATAGTQGALNNAIQSNNTPSPTTVKLTKAGTYTLPEMSGKDVTIVGTKDTVIDMKGEDGKGVVNKAAAASFEGVTVMFGADDYKGFQHTGKLTYKDCTITGKQFLYANEVEFINCKFVQDAVDYNVWTYGAGKVLFKDCEFECKGKAVLIYNEGAQSEQTVEFQSCKFNASALAKGKAAIEIDSSLVEKGFTVTIDKATADSVTGFDNGSVSHNTVWNNKKGEKATVIVNGKTVLAAK